MQKANKLLVMKVNCVLIYPPVDGIQSPVSIRHIPIELNIGCHKWQTNTAMRHGFCELVFAGAGNHPGLYDGGPNYYGFDSGDAGINNVHGQWEVATARSMSVGDMLNIDPNGINEFWLCDSVGFVLLTEEQAWSWLNYPREFCCDSIALMNWKKRNGMES